MQAIRKADCPNCGGPIEFKLGASRALICGYCRFSVLRRGQELDAIGRVAELVPTAAAFGVGDSGSIEGRPFVVGGRLQLDHGKGPWDEWYVELEGRRWGWLAQAQGRWYLTHPIPDAQAPDLAELEPGSQVSLPSAGNTRLSVDERGESRLLSAEGELPFAATPESLGSYADLSGPDGIFVSIDYGDGSEDAQVYVGRQIPADQIEVRGRALGPSPEEKAAADRLRCPSCGAPVEIHTPQSTERAACGSCNSLLDYSQGALAFLKKLQQETAQAYLPLGSEGVLKGEQLTVIGFMRRTTRDSGVRYTWSEYLLHGKQGYRWLLEDMGHWTLLKPVQAGEVQMQGATARHRGKRFKSFQSGSAQVCHVVGEFYWSVEVGETAETEDFVAPPHLLSRERTDREVSYSRGEYVPGAEVWKAFDMPGGPPHSRGIAPSQPNPTQLRWTGGVAAALMLLLTLAWLSLDAGHSSDELASLDLQLPPSDTRGIPNSPPPPQGEEKYVVYSPPFDILDDVTTLKLELKTSASNAWVGAASALINEDSGQVREFYLMAQEWHGRTGGESWSEGSPGTTEYLGKVKQGRYVMRFAADWGSKTGRRGTPPAARVKVTAGERSSLCCFFSGFLMLLPLAIAAIRRGVFEARRWSQSDSATSMLEGHE